MDLAVSQFVFSLLGRWGWLDGFIIFLARFLPYLMGAAFLFFIFQIKPWSRRLYFIFFAALTVILSRGFITEVIRFFYLRPRPFEVLPFKPLFQVGLPAFPSSHAVFLFSLAFTLWFFNRRWGWAFAVAALINGLARVFSGVHWPTDIIGGLFIALFSAIFINFLLKKIYSVKEKTADLI